VEVTGSQVERTQIFIQLCQKRRLLITLR